IATTAILTPFVGPIVAAAAGAALVTGLSGGHLGDILRNAAIAGATAFAFAGVGTLTPGGDVFGSGAFAARVAGDAGVGCLSALASHGSCGPAALSAAAGAAVGPIVPTQSLVGLVITAAVGGAASVAGGGKFENGAVTAAFAYLATPQGGGR